MPADSKRIRKPTKQSWKESHKDATDSVQQRKRREQLKGKEKREKSKEKKMKVEDHKGQRPGGGPDQEPNGRPEEQDGREGYQWCEEK